MGVPEKEVNTIIKLMGGWKTKIKVTIKRRKTIKSC